MSRLNGIVIVCLVFIPAFTGPVTMHKADAAQSAVAALRCKIINRVNEFRLQNGKSCLKYNAALQKAAQEYAVWFAGNMTKGSGLQFGHQADGKTPTRRAQDAGYKPKPPKTGKIVHKKTLANGDVIKKTMRRITSYNFVGENILYFEGNDICKPDGFLKASIEGWKNSKVHRINMLSGSWDATGVGVAMNKATRRCFGIQMFGVAGKPASKDACRIECR